jgi:hypothetical protein
MRERLHCVGVEDSETALLPEKPATKGGKRGDPR